MNADEKYLTPGGRPGPVVREGEFVFGAAGLEHGHIADMTRSLLEAGATLKWVYDPDPEKVRDFQKKFPQARAARCED